MWKGKVVEVYLVASHEKVPRVEKNYLGLRAKCNNSDCPSKIDIKKIE